MFVLLHFVCYVSVVVVYCKLYVQLCYGVFGFLVLWFCGCFLFIVWLYMCILSAIAPSSAQVARA